MAFGKILSVWQCLYLVFTLSGFHATATATATPENCGKSGTAVPNFEFKELYGAATTFFDNFMYPKNAAQAKLINSTLFDEHVLGRVDATRTFNGRELNTEYAFGLFSNIALNPKAFTLLGVPINYNITHFAANQNIMSVALIVNFNITALNVVTPVEVDFWATLNELKQISQYDVTFRFLQWEFDTLIELGKQIFHINSTAAMENLASELLINSICNVAQTYCNGTNQQYTSLDDCKKVLHTLPFGTAYQLGMSTILCRMVHQNMVPYRPDVHCPHIGPSGGGYCTNDRTYDGTILQPYFVNSPFVPYGYQNKNKTVAEM